MNIPRGPIFQLDSDKADYCDKYKEKVLAFRDNAKSEAFRTARQAPEFNNIQKYISYLEGSQWAKTRPVYKSRFTNNRLEQARKDRLALITDSKPAIEVTTTLDEYKETAKIIGNVIRAEWFKQDIDLSLVSVADLAMLCGTAFWKIGAAPPGVMRIIPCGPDNVMPIQPGFHIQDSSAVLYRTPKTVQYFKRVFPFTSEGIERETGRMQLGEGNLMKPSNMSDYTWNGLAPGLQRLMGVKNTTELGNPYSLGVVELEEYYVEDFSVNESKYDVVMRHPYVSLRDHNYWYVVRPGERLYPRKRLIVFGGNRLVYDGPSPFFHGLYPFACLRFNPVPWSFYGLSTYRNLLPLQEAINDIAAGIMDMTKKSLNPTMISKTNAVTAASWGAFQGDKPGAKLLLGPMGNPASDIQYGPVPQIPPYVFQLLSQFVLPEFDKQAGLMDVGAMSRKNQVPGGDTLEQMRDSLQTSLRLDMRFMEAFLRDAGTLAVSDVVQYYNTRRRLQYLGEDGITLHDFDFNGDNLVPASECRESFWKNFGFTVIPGSVHGGAKDRSKMEAASMAGMGLISKHEFLRTLDKDPGDIERIIEEMAQEAQMMAPPDGSRTPRTPSKKMGNPM